MNLKKMSFAQKNIDHEMGWIWPQEVAQHIVYSEAIVTSSKSKINKSIMGTETPRIALE